MVESPESDAAQSMCAVLGTLLSVGGAVVVWCAQSFNHMHLTCKAGITNTSLRC